VFSIPGLEEHVPRVCGSNWTTFREQCKRRAKKEKPTGECHSLG
jgi:hypothetical protein